MIAGVCRPTWRLINEFGIEAIDRSSDNSSPAAVANKAPHQNRKFSPNSKAFCVVLMVAARCAIG
jgi:hypothetical protein